MIRAEEILRAAAKLESMTDEEFATLRPEESIIIVSSCYARLERIILELPKDTGWQET